MATKLNNCTATRGEDPIGKPQSVRLLAGPSGNLEGELVASADCPLPKEHEILVLTTPGHQAIRARVTHVIVHDSAGLASIGFEIMHLPPDVQGKVPPAAQ